MNIVIKIDNIDATSAVYNLSKIPVYARNYDFSQIFTDINFTLSYKFKQHGEIKKGETIVEAFIDGNCVYTGYVDSATISGYYRKKIKVKHITQKLKLIKPLEDAKDITRVYRLRPEFIFDSSTFDGYQLLASIFENINYTTLSIPDNYIDANNDLDEILTSNEILNNIKYWGQEVEFDELKQEIFFLLDPEKAPSLWELLILLQKTFHFSCRFESLFSVDKKITITTPGYFYAKDFSDIPAQGGVDPSFNGLKDKINIINSNLLSDIPTSKAVKQESNNVQNQYVDIELYGNPTTAEEPKEIKNNKAYQSVKFKEKKITYPNNFVFVKENIANMDNLPFVLSAEFQPLQERFVVSQAPISIYARWMNYQDYADIGIYVAGFERAAVSYLDVKYYLQEWDNQVLTKMPRKVDYNTKNKVFEITQDEPERN